MTSASKKELCIIAVLGDHQRKVVFSGGMDQLLFAIERELKDLLKPGDKISHLMEYDKDLNDYIDLRDRIPEQKSKIKVVLKEQEEDDFVRHVKDIQGFKIEKILSEQLESVATTSCCQVMTRLSSTSNFVAYYSDSDISTQTQNRKEQVTALLKTKVIAEKVDVCFLLDCTGSMEPWMKAVKDNILKWRCRLYERYTDAQLRFAFVRYTDFDQPEATRTTFMDFTSIPDDFAQFIDGIKIEGGGDAPEDVFGGLKVATQNLNWIVDPRTKMLIHIADAPCHGREYHSTEIQDSYPNGDPNNNTPHDLLTAIYEKNIQYIFGYINQSTDKMLSIFREVASEISNDKFRIQTICATDPDSLEQLIFDSMVSSMAETIHTLTGTSYEPIELDKNEPNWDELEDIIATITPTVDSKLCENMIDQGCIPNTPIGIKMGTKPFDHGHCRQVYHGLITHSMAHIVLKENISRGKRNTFLKRYVEDYRVHLTAIVYSRMFNDDKPADIPPIRFVTPSLLGLNMKKDSKQMKWFFVEPYIAGKYEKFNSNTGYVAKASDINDAMQAFSHFTWKKSGHRILVCDLQGILTDKGIVLTDPCIHSRDVDLMRYGRTNLGSVGVILFFATHKCNKVCSAMGLPAYFVKE